MTERQQFLATARYHLESFGYKLASQFHVIIEPHDFDPAENIQKVVTVHWPLAGPAGAGFHGHDVSHTIYEDDALLP